MTNAEEIMSKWSYEDVANIIRSGCAGYNCDFIRAKILQSDGCDGIKCEKCKERVIEWLKKRHICSVMEEYEYRILARLPKIWKYIARNKDGSLYIFTQKPNYSALWGEWYLDRQSEKKEYKRTELTCIYGDDIFPFIKYNESFWRIDKLVEEGKDVYEISSDT